MRVRGNAIFPASIAGRFSILFAILRQLALVLSTAIFSSELKTLDPDVFFVDQLSACVPLLRLLCPKARVLFYGHFPDRLLAKEGSGISKVVKGFYRRPFDAVESWSTGCADSIVVNSKFTRSVFRQTFASTKNRELKVVYPCVDTQAKSPPDDPAPWPDKRVLLSINRYEGKKNLALAIRAFAGLSSDEREKAKLVIAGGYDPRVHENVNTLKFLQEQATSLDLTHSTIKGAGTAALASDTNSILFLLSVPDTLKTRLLTTARLLIYTPQNEHFGIVPLEAMLARVPVLATNTGGPLETIYDGRTGWLRSPEKVEQWTAVLRKPLIPSSEDSLKLMGERGRERVLAEFSHTKMTKALEEEMARMCGDAGKRPSLVPQWAGAFVATGLVAVVGVVLGIWGWHFLLGRWRA